MRGVRADARRTARLLLPEVDDPAALDRPEVLEAVDGRRVPAWITRRLQARAVAAGDEEVLADLVEAPLRAREAVLGAAAAGPPRVLVRLEAPDPAAHTALRDAGVPYLVPTAGAPPARLGALRRDGVELALRERLDGGRLDRARRQLEQDRLHAEVLQPVLDDAAHRRWSALQGRFRLAVGGPEAVRHLGLQRGPAWRGPAVWLPCVPPLHGPAAQVAGAVEALAARGAALWLHVTLTDVDGAERLAPFARPWAELLEAVASSSGPPAPSTARGG